MQGRRVVVTGLGMVTPLGLTVAETWAAVLAGKSGVSKIDTFDTQEYAVQIAAFVRGFDANRYMPAKEIKKIDAFGHFGVAAAQEAVADAGITFHPEHAHRYGVAIGSGVGGMPLIEKMAVLLEESGPRKISPFFIPAVIVNILAGRISIDHGLKGPNLCFVSACATGAHNIGHAARAIAYGDADVMVAGGAEMAISPLSIAGFSQLRALSRRNDAPEKASRPFDKDRDGFIMGEGAGVLILEEYEHAKARNARIYAELTGFGQTGDAYHTTSPEAEGRGAAAAIAAALADAKLNTSQIQHVNAHATSTPAGDEIECMAIKRAFGEQVGKIAVSATKSMTGHLLGAAGAIESIFCILALRDQVVPPTINLDEPSPDCDLDFVPHRARNMQLKSVLNNSFGFGGTNAALIFTTV